MRILQISSKVPFPPKDGGALAVYMFSMAFARLGHQVQVLAVNPPKHFVTEIKGLPDNLSVIPVRHDTTPRLLPLLKNLLLDSRPYQVIRFISKDFEKILLNEIREYKPDIIQLEGIFFCPYISLIRRHTKAPVILRAHNVEHLIWQQIASSEKNILKRFYLKIQALRMKKYEEHQISCVDGVATFTDQDLALFRQFNSEIKSKAIPFGMEKFPEVDNKSFTFSAISFIGALDWVPNQEAVKWFVNEVWTIMYQQFPDLKFHIAGRNAPAGMVSFLKTAKGVIFHGEVEDSTVFLHQFKVLVVPLFSGSGIRVKIIEAMNCGVVVIASSKAIEGIQAIPGRHFLKADDAAEFVSSLASLMKDQDLLKEISFRAKAYANENFDILALGSELTKFYHEIING